MPRRLRAIVPVPVRRLVRATMAGVKEATWRLRDEVEVISGRRDPLVPPPRLSDYVGPSDFVQTGDEYLRYFVALGQLQPDARVLDVGCGIGRMARPLTTYLNASGSYEGFDVVAQGIRWCTRAYRRRHPSFCFQAADVVNHLYNPQGRSAASQYRFPYDAAAFDFVFAVSVFTHLLPDAMENYLGEVARVLRPTGRCLLTWLLLNEESEPLIADGKSYYNFASRGPGYRTTHPDNPEYLIAHEESAMRRLYRDHGLRIVEPIHYGSWSGRTQTPPFQDLVVAEPCP